jgi:surfactin synthase thioesterase subunit
VARNHISGNKERSSELEDVMSNNKWLDSVHHNPGARIRLFCFAHAGGAANVFAQWWRKLPADIEVCPIQLPGRWSRWREEPVRDLLMVSRSLARELASELASKPALFYGHSLGGLLAYETTLRLREDNRGLPRGLIVSGRRPPDAAAPGAPLHRLPDEAFAKAVAVRYEAIDERLLLDEDMRGRVLHVFRADLEMLETYRPTQAEPLGIPIWVFSASDDKIAPPEDMYGWTRFSTCQVKHQTIEGGHFFIRNSETFWQMLAAVIGDV